MTGNIAGGMRNRASLWTRVKRQKFVLLMLAPAFVLTLIFSYPPLTGWIMAFTQYKVGQSMFGAQFTGLLQFRRFFMDSKDYIYLLRNTLVINCISVAQNLVVAIPPALEEAVLIGGGTETDVFFRVLLPICLPVNAAILLFSAIQHRNSFIDNQFYNAMNPELYTLQYVLYNALAVQLHQSLEEAKMTRKLVTGESLKMAITVIAAIPIMCVYPF